jgi:hypothetical protein
MQARYHANVQGRFMSPDPGNAGAGLGNPQSWNGYSYVGNNPMAYIDPSGLTTCDSSGNNCYDSVTVTDGSDGWPTLPSAPPGTCFSVILDGVPQQNNCDEGLNIITLDVQTPPPGPVSQPPQSDSPRAVAFQWAVGSSHSIQVVTLQQPGGSGTQTQYLFSGWSDALGATHTITVPAPGSTIAQWTANFSTQYYVSTSAGSGGSISPASGYYGAGGLITVTATASQGYQFSGYSGSLTGALASQGLIVGAPGVSVAATFANASPPTVLTRSLVSAQTSTPYAQALYAAGGAPSSYSWALARGSQALPSWLSLSAGGGLTGTPPFGAAGTTVSFSVQATDANDLTSAPQTLTLPVYFAALSINGGTNDAETFPGVTVPLVFSYYDQNGADDLGWAQFYLADSSGNLNCLGDWGRPDGLYLYDAIPNTGATWVLNTNQSDNFCTVSLASIVDSDTDPTEVTVTLNFTFAAGSLGTYAVMSQANYLSGFVGSWENVGSLTIENPTNQLPVSSAPVTQPPTESAPVPIPPGPVTLAVTNCNDVSGTWSDVRTILTAGEPTQYETVQWSLAQSGQLVTGTATEVLPDNSAEIWTVSSGTSVNGVVNLTASNPTQPYPLGGYFEAANPITTHFYVASCGSGFGSDSDTYPSYVNSFGPQPRKYGGPYTTKWTATSASPGLQLTFDLMGSTVTAVLTGQNKTANLQVQLVGTGSNTAILSAGSVGARTISQRFDERRFRHSTRRTRKSLDSGIIFP